MAEERAQRHLAAILAADVVGYSRLMEQDEAGTFARLRAHRVELFEPAIDKYHGRIFKLMGDGLLAEFGSVVDAVECASAMQEAMAERNSGLAADGRIDIRIGINLGDVIVEGEDRHGEGVNIAARLLAAEVRHRKRDFSAARFVSKEPLRRVEDQQLLLEGFRIAGLPE